MGEKSRTRSAVLHKWRLRHTQLYPMQVPLILAGLSAAAISLVLQNWVISVAMLALFGLVGASWRSDIVPIMPACIAYQWLFACTGYIYHWNLGEFPGGGYSPNLPKALLLALLGFAALVAGWRLALRTFAKQILSTTLVRAKRYRISTLAVLTVGAFAVHYVFDVLPMRVWFGGAQIIENLLALRFIPYFILLVVVFERRRGYSYAALLTLFVIGPELLTGFSGFKEILFVAMIAALARWRPWVRSVGQQRQNGHILLFGFAGVLVVGVLGIVWSGGVKDRWREQIWREGVGGSPVERMALFFNVVDRAVQDLDVSQAGVQLAARVSSGGLYFAYVTERVPDLIPHENGVLLAMALRHATQPRFLFPDKANLGGDSWLVREYAGIDAAGDETGASIGLGYLAQFYIDFGVLGVVVLAGFWGFCGGAAMALLAKAAPSPEIFVALVIVLFTQYFMSFDGSFIKLFAGAVQRTLIAAAVFGIAGRIVAHRIHCTSRRKVGRRGPIVDSA